MKPMQPPRPAVLVVDADTQLLELFALLLDDAGYTVRGVTTLDQAAAALAEQRPAIVITELHLPGAAPLAMLHHVAADPTTRDLPVLVCTAVMDALTELERHRRAAPTAVLPKPFDIDRLLHCVEQLVAGKLPDPAP
jgi:two-component system, NtrC family, response regulator GlrR